MALTNAIRGLLAEQGFVFRQGDKPLEEGLQELLSRADPVLSAPMSQLLSQLWLQVVSLKSQVAELDRQIESFAKSDSRCAKIQKIEGVGPITATAIVATIGDGRAFKNGDSYPRFWV